MAASWWSGWVQSAKEKGSAALDMVVKDLSEFGCTMQKDAGQAVEVTRESLKAENTSAAKDKFTKGLNTFLDGISKALYVPPDDDDQVPIIAPGSDCYDRAKARILAVQVDPGTYLHEPCGSPETYSMWCEGTDLEDKKGEISDLLVSKVEVRALYTKLVPSKVSHVDFWRRYFYKLHLLDVDQARKEMLMKRADQSTKAEDSISWDDDWSGDEEAAEDSGSDWEKLPRPNQQPPQPQPQPQPTPTPTIPSLTTSTPNLTTSTPSLSVPDQPVTHQNVKQQTPGAQNTEFTSIHQELREVGLEEVERLERSAASQPKREVPEPTKESSEFVPASVVAAPPQSVSVLSPVQETSGVSSEKTGGGGVSAMAKLKAMAADKVKEPEASRVQETKDVASSQKSSASSEGGDAAAATESGTKPPPALSPQQPQDSPPSPKYLSDVTPTPTTTASSPSSPQVASTGSPVSAGGESVAKLADESTSVADATTTSQASGLPPSPQTSPAAETVKAAPSHAVARDLATEKKDVAAEKDLAAEKKDLAAEKEVEKEDSVAEKTGEAASLAARGASGVGLTLSVDVPVSRELKTTDKGDLVLVGSDHGSPVSNNSDSKEGKSDLDDDWEQDLDIELTEEDMAAAEELAKKLGENLNLEDEDWESWE